MGNEYTCQMLTPGNGLPCRHYLRPEVKGEPGFCQQPTRFRCTEAMKRHLPSISYSSLSNFIQCKRKYYHSAVEGLQVKAQYLPDPMKLGKAWDGWVRHKHDGYDYKDEFEALRLSGEQQAKNSALTRAHEDLGILNNKDGLLGCQYKISCPIGTTQITGFVDRAYEDHILETKLSSRPDFYQQRENVAFQLGTYFLGSEAWEYAIVEIARVPALRTGQGRYQDEEPDQFEQRVYSDIISRPAHYFLGWDRKTKTYGVKFWRSEFDLDELFATYTHVLREIKDTVERGSWWRNNLACHVPAPCPFLPIKRTGVVSEEIFEKRQRKGGG